MIYKNCILNRFLFYCDRYSIISLTVRTLVVLILYASFWLALFASKTIETVNNSTIEDFEDSIKILLIVAIAPIIETLIFQSLIVHVLLKLYKGVYKYCVVVILSTATFALTHSYDIYHFLYAIGLGFVFVMYYLVVLNQRHNPIVATIALHSIFNTIGYSLQFLIDF